MRRILFAVLLFSFPAHAQDAQKSTTGASPQKNTQIDKIDGEDSAVLQRHFPFYFIYGEPLSKLQFSFKSPFVRKVPVYFAYTQVMFWELKEDSKPFRDLTYNPEIFYRWTTENWGGFFESIDLGIWGHNSNGKKEKDSRSYDKQYVRLNFAREGHRWVTRFGTELAYLHRFDKGNSDLREFIGPVSFFISFIQLFETTPIDKGEISFKASPGGKYADEWDQGGYQISYAFRLGKLKVVPAFYIQYYHGYAETLLNYNEHVDEIRGGFLF